jgi:PAS domain S-box-containing protein
MALSGSASEQASRRGTGLDTGEHNLGIELFAPIRLSSLFAALKRHPETVPESLAVAQELIEAVPVPVFLKGRDGRYVGVNKAWEDFFGIPRDAIIGKTHFDRETDPSVVAKHPTEDEELWNSPGRRTYEIRVSIGGGAVRDIIIHKGTFAHANGEVAGMVGTIVDITERKEAERARQDSEARFRSLTEHIPDALFFVDDQGRLTDVNPAALVLTGCSRENLIRRPIWSLVARPSFNEADWRGLLADDHRACECAVRQKDGQSVDVELYAVAKVAPHVHLAIARDIRARKQAQGESNTAFKDLFDDAPIGYHELNADGRFTRVNRTELAMLGYREDEMLGHFPWEFVVEKVSREAVASKLTGHVSRGAFERTLKRKDGSQLPVLIEDRLIRNNDGTVQGIRTAIVDNSARKWAEENLAAANQRLTQDVAARKLVETQLREAHDALSHKAEELAQSNEELQHFAYVASHDLQEPLRMVSSYTQLLERRYATAFDGDAKEFMAFIVDGATRMKQLIEDLLAYSRVGTGGREMQSADCGAALQRALLNLRAAIEASGATITHGPLPTVTGDGSQLAQLFQNLIGNAIKFRSTDAPCIDVGAQEQDNAWVVSVKDNGIGIDPQYFERIFIMFQRLHAKGDYSGTGIGLAICKKIIDRHGGRIWAESLLGHGCTFCFTLPKPREADPEGRVNPPSTDEHTSEARPDRRAQAKGTRS